MTKYKYLDKINFPSDLKTLGIKELKILADELRTELIEVVAETGRSLRCWFRCRRINFSSTLCF